MEGSDDMIDKKGNFVITWSPEDVIERGKMHTPPKNITNNQAKRVLELCDHRHDCNYGMTWGLMDDCIVEVLH